MPYDRTRYPPTWDSEIRPRIRRRSGEVLADDGKTVVAPARCEWCGGADRAVGWHQEISKEERLRFFSHVEIDEVLHRSGYDHFQHELADADPLKPVRIVMTVSHLDHDETNWAVTDERLACLCMTCHLRHDKPDNWRRRKLNLWARARRQFSLFPSLAPGLAPVDAPTQP